MTSHPSNTFRIRHIHLYFRSFLNASMDGKNIIAIARSQTMKSAILALVFSLLNHIKIYRRNNTLAKFQFYDASVGHCKIPNSDVKVKIKKNVFGNTFNVCACQHVSAFVIVASKFSSIVIRQFLNLRLPLVDGLSGVSFVLHGQSAVMWLM